MRRIAAACLFSLLLTTAILSAQGTVSMPSIWRYAHPEAKALMGLEWNRIVNSPLGQQLRQKITESGLPNTELSGIIEGVERIFISSPGIAEGSAEEQPPVVMAIQGQFDLEMLRNLASARLTGISSYQSIDILEQQESATAPMALALVDEKTVLLGDVDSVKAAIDHHLAADPGQVSDPLYASAMNMAASNDIWIVSNSSLSDFSQGSQQQAAFLNDVKSMEVGISLQNGLGIQLNMGTENEEAAQNIAGGLQFMISMMLANQQSQPGMPDLSKKLQVSTSNSLVQLAMSLDQAELEQAFSQVGSSMMPALAAGMVDVEPAMRGSGEMSWGGEAQPNVIMGQSPAPAREQVIRIYGLEEGLREIPMDK